MTLATRPVVEVAVRAALDTVLDPELDEPITDLGFVRSVTVEGDTVSVRLRLPTSFCSPNFAYLMASDAKDAVRAVAGVAAVTVELDDHHDSGLINRGLAADAGYVGTFGHEAERSLDDLRAVFRAKAHVAAMERALAVAGRGGADPSTVIIGDLPPGRERDALVSRRAALGLPTHDGSPVLVDAAGRPVPAERAQDALRRARSVRISVDGNAHFCRGLLRTRYPGSGADQVPRADGTHPALPLLATTVSPEESS